MARKPDHISDYFMPTQRLAQGDPSGRSFQDLSNRRWTLAGIDTPNPLPVPGINPGGHSIPGVDGDRVWNMMAPPGGRFYPAYYVYNESTGERGWLLADWDTLEPTDKFYPIRSSGLDAQGYPKDEAGYGAYECEDGDEDYGINAWWETGEESQTWEVGGVTFTNNWPPDPDPKPWEYSKTGSETYNFYATFQMKGDSGRVYIQASDLVQQGTISEYQHCTYYGIFYDGNQTNSGFASFNGCAGLEPMYVWNTGSKYMPWRGYGIEFVPKGDYDGPKTSYVYSAREGSMSKEWFQYLVYHGAQGGGEWWDHVEKRMSFDSTYSGYIVFDGQRMEIPHSTMYRTAVGSGSGDDVNPVLWNYPFTDARHGWDISESIIPKKLARPQRKWSYYGYPPIDMYSIEKLYACDTVVCVSITDVEVDQVQTKFAQGTMVSSITAANTATGYKEIYYLYKPETGKIVGPYVSEGNYIKGYYSYYYLSVVYLSNKQYGSSPTP